MGETFVRDDVKLFLEFLNNAPGPKIHEVGPAEARAMSRAMRDLADAPACDLATIRDFAMPGPQGGEIPLRLYDPRPHREPGPLLVYYHGGGFVLGDLNSHEPACAEIARGLDLPVVSVDYRLSPEHLWPAAPDDAEAAARWIADGAEQLERKVTGLVLAGDSAGGALTIITALALRDRPARVPVLVQWPIYPVVDLSDRYASLEQFGEGFLLAKQGMRWFNEHYRPGLNHWRASPILADQAGLPPTFVLTAGLDPLRDQGRAYAAATIHAGVPTIYREAIGNIHGFLNLRRAIPSSEGDLNAALAVLKPMILEAEANRVMAQAAAAR